MPMINYVHLSPDMRRTFHSNTNQEPQYFKYFLGKGNNEEIVRKVMKKRFWFKETTETNHLYNFCWQQTTKGIYYERLCANRALKQIVNHFEFHREISNKINLIRNLQMYCEVRES